LVLDAHSKAILDKVENATDDCQLVMRLGHRVFTVLGDEQNIKITYPIDMHLADKLFQLRQELTGALDDDAAQALKGKTVSVIGGTDGIGQALCQKLEEAGATVFALSRRSEPSVDVTDLSTVENGLAQVAEQVGQIDYIVNCAGELSRKNVEFMSVEQWRNIWSVNMDGCFNVAKAAIPFLRETKGGLLFVGSSSYTRGRGGYAAYSSSKAALVNFVQALAEELSQDHIQVNVINPGRVRTSMRLRNFGQEPPESLLDPDYVAAEMIKALLMDTSGSVFEVR
jgi:2-C-methyl-D-erythritol 4-phosphate cytidylyltransferase